MVIKLNATSNDPYAAFDMTSLSQISADEYKFIVLRVKTDRKVKVSTSAIFYACGSTMGAVGGQTVWFDVPQGDEWSYHIIDMSKKPGWSGKINNLRFDIFDGPTVEKGLSMTYSMIAFAKTREDAEKLTHGYVPEGCIADFGAFKQKLTDVLAVKKEFSAILADAQKTYTDGAAALEAAAALKDTNQNTPALYAEAEALLQKVNTTLTALKDANTAVQAMTNEVEDAQTRLASAKDAMTALQADAQALTAKLDELAAAAAKTEPVTTEQPTEQPSEDQTDDENQGGCKSAVSAALLLVMLAGLGITVLKKCD